MNPPFTTGQFLKVFENYNTSVFPMQIVFYLLCTFVIYLALKKKSYRTINSLLAFFWLWMGVVYHIMFFTSINTAAYAFGILFIVQSFVILFFGVFRTEMSYSFSKDIYGYAGILLFVYSLVIYPLIGFILGHVYPSSPTLGLPCPTTIFTFGVFLWSDKKFPLVILIIPFIWSIIGFTAVLNFGIKEDSGLLVAGVLALIMLLFKNKKYTSVSLQQN